MYFAFGTIISMFAIGYGAYTLKAINKENECQCDLCTGNF